MSVGKRFQQLGKPTQRDHAHLGSAAPQRMIGAGQQVHPASRPRNRFTEPVTLALQDENRYADRVELGLPRHSARADEGEGQREQSGRLGDLDGPRCHPSPAGPPAGNQRDVRADPLAGRGDCHDPCLVQRGGGHRQAPPRDPVGLL
ncbi:MAG: hypothetical protein M3500_16615, partial [Actinomycetota bacterium]|nr:hypothetical protein [Actinomycetota bacterium]